MNNVSYFKRGKEKTEKGQMRVAGVVLGVLTLLALIGGLGMVVAYPLLIDTSAPSVIEFFKQAFTSGNARVMVWAGLFAAIILVSALYIFIMSCKMFSKNIKHSGNVRVGLTAALAVLFFWGMHELNNNLAMPLYSLGFDVFHFAVLGAFVFVIIYQFIVAGSCRKLWDDSGKKFNGLFVLSILTCLIAAASGVVYYSFETNEIILTYEWYAETLSAPFRFLTSAAGTVAVEGELYTIVYSAAVALQVITLFATIILAGVLVVSLFFNFAKLGADKNYVRGSNYFSKTSPMKTACAFAFANLFFSMIIPIIDVIYGEGVISRLEQVDLFYAIVFGVVLILSIICAVIANRDKKLAKDEEYSYGVLEEDAQPEVVDLTEETVEEPAISEQEQIEEENRQAFISYGEDLDEKAETEQEDFDAAALFVDASQEETVEEPVNEVVEEVAEEVVEQPANEIIEEKVEEKMEEQKAPIQEEVKAEQPTMPNAQMPYPQMPQGYMPYVPYMPYPPMGYPQGYMPYMPYPQMPQMPNMPPQPQPASTMIYIPIYGGAQTPVSGQGFPGQPAPIVTPTPASPVVASAYDGGELGDIEFDEIDATPVVAPIVNPTPIVETPAPTPAPIVEEAVVTEEPEEIDEVEEVAEVEDKPLVIERKTMEEKYNELPSKIKKYYNDVMKYAESKEGVKRNQATYADSVFYGRDCIIKVQIKQSKVVCSFSLINYEVKEMLKSGKGAKEQKTVVKVVDAETFELAKQSIDMAYQLALEAKEARHQEQLRKRREARARKNAEKNA